MLVARSMQNLLKDALNQNYMDGTENYAGGCREFFFGLAHR